MAGCAILVLFTLEVCSQAECFFTDKPGEELALLTIAAQICVGKRGTESHLSMISVQPA